MMLAPLCVACGEQTERAQFCVVKGKIALAGWHCGCGAYTVSHYQSERPPEPVKQPVWRTIRAVMGLAR
jgi:hypothetical protein